MRDDIQESSVNVFLGALDEAARRYAERRAIVEADRDPIRPNLTHDEELLLAVCALEQ